MHQSDVGDLSALHLDVLGVRVDLQVGGSRARELREAIEDPWSWCRVDGDGEPEATLEVWLDDEQGGRTPDLYVDRHVEVVGGHDLATVLDVLSPAVTQRAIAARAGQLLMLHAAALAHPDTGATAVLVGPSGAGKTTVATALGRHFAYLTDETVGVLPDYRVVGYPKPLSVLDQPRDAVKRQISPGELGLSHLYGPEPRVRSVILLDRQPGGDRLPSVTRIQTVDALPELAAQSSYSRRLDRPLRRLAALAEVAGGVRRVTYREADDLVPVVGELLSEVRR